MTKKARTNSKVFKARRRRLRDRPFLPFLFISFPILSIFWFGSTRQDASSSSSSSSSSSMRKDTTTPSPCHKPRVSYEKTKEATEAHYKYSQKNITYQRYSAVEACEEEEGGSSKPVSVLRWAQLLSHEDRDYATDLAKNVTQIIKDSPYQACYFETKGVTSKNANSKPFELVLVDAPWLFQFAKHPDPKSFQEHFDELKEDAAAAVFDNLGGTATLVAPRPLTSDSTAYGHLTAFARDGESEQVHSVWRIVAETYRKRLEADDDAGPVWFSTAGTGVPWLHFRFDKEPKYYNFAEFANEK